MAEGGEVAGVTRRSIFAAALAISAALGAGGCTSAPWAGIPLEAGAADPALQELARLAANGDKQAQLDLGIRYEEGRGVPVDVARAAELYRMAAEDSSGGVQVYVPDANGPGHVETINMGAPVQGLEEAARRLRALEIAGSASTGLADGETPAYVPTHLGSWSYPFEGHEAFVEPPSSPLEFTVRKWRYSGQVRRSGPNGVSAFPCDALGPVLPYYFGQGVESCSSLPVTATFGQPNQTAHIYDIGVNLEPSSVNPDAPRFVLGAPILLEQRDKAICGKFEVDQITVNGQLEYYILTDVDEDKTLC